MGVNRYLGGVISADPNTPTVTSASGTWTLAEAYQNIGNWPMAQSQIQNSLRFNSADSAYLSRTPASAGNRKTWTFSAWIKRSTLSATQGIFHCYDGSSSRRSSIQFNSDNTIGWDQGGSGTSGLIDTVAVYRDVSAWYHLVCVADYSNGTAANRAKIYINNVLQTVTTTDDFENADGLINSTNPHQIGSVDTVSYFNGYLTEINFIDGLALDPDYFGFTDANGIWQPKPYKGAYGTNGFYLPMTLSATATGFSTVTYEGTGSTQVISGVGFAPDFIWSKSRSNSGYNHTVVDVVRGNTKILRPSNTDAEGTYTDAITGFTSDGFTLGADTSGQENNVNNQNYVAWCWDAGSSTVTNNDGTITSTVRASQTNGVSVVTWTNASNGDATVGHGLGAAPKLIITKKRSTTNDWYTFTTAIDSSYDYLKLNATDAKVDSAKAAPTSTVFTTDMGDTSTAVAYCFSEISGFSKIGTYSGSGASGNTVTLGFKPAFVMIKRTDTTGGWSMFDSVRTGPNSLTNRLVANTSGAEIVETTDNYITITSTGFSVNGNGGITNASGGTYLYIAFADTRAFDPFDDYSGNGNNWQPNNIGTDDVFTDVPTNQGTDTGAGGEVRGNYATLNPLTTIRGSSTLSDGNLKASVGSNSWWTRLGTMSIITGKWYFEYNVTGSGTVDQVVGWATSNYVSTSGEQGNYQFSLYTASDGNGYVYVNATSTNKGTTWAFTFGDVVMIAFDADANKIWFGKNGSWFGSGNPAAGTNEAGGFSSASYITQYGATPIVSGYWSGSTPVLNFGQKPFSYTAPSGFKALCTQNLPTPTILDGGDYFNAVLYTGNGTSQTINTGLQPDFTWIKDRTLAWNNKLFDTNRGVGKYLISDSTAAEATDTNQLSAFLSNGFSVGSQVSVNGSGDAYVAWNWKAGGTGVSNTAGSITSTVSANTTAGFSIITYTGNGTSGATIGHGLSSAPAFFVVKGRSFASNWLAQHISVGNGSAMTLNSTAAASASSTYWNNTSPSSTVITLGNGSETNPSGSTMVCYAFAPVSGYSAFGSYQGTNTTDNVFVYCGFRPRYLLIKCSSTGGTSSFNWVVYDSERSAYNATTNVLWPSLSALENSSSYSPKDGPAGNGDIDFLSNGFKVRSSASAMGGSNTYIYAAFAENPFKLSRAR